MMNPNSPRQASIVPPAWRETVTMTGDRAKSAVKTIESLGPNSCRASKGKRQRTTPESAGKTLAAASLDPKSWKTTDVSAR
jgi:hypothetical protein